MALGNSKQQPQLLDLLLELNVLIQSLTKNDFREELLSIKKEREALNRERIEKNAVRVNQETLVAQLSKTQIAAEKAAEKAKAEKDALSALHHENVKTVGRLKEEHDKVEKVKKEHEARHMKDVQDLEVKNKALVDKEHKIAELQKQVGELKADYERKLSAMKAAIG